MKNLSKTAAFVATLLCVTISLISCSDDAADVTDGDWQIVEMEDPMTGTTLVKGYSLTTVSGGSLETEISCKGWGYLSFKFTIHGAQIPWKYVGYNAYRAVGRIRVNEKSSAATYQNNTEFENVFEHVVREIVTGDDDFVEKNDPSKPISIVLFEIPTDMDAVILEVPGTILSRLHTASECGRIHEESSNKK